MRHVLLRAGLACATAALTLTACDLSPDTPAKSPHSSRPSHITPLAPRPRKAPLPAGTAALPAIPAVRGLHPAAGKGWWPQPATRVIAEDPTVRDEAGLFAGELGTAGGHATATWGDRRTPAHVGDVRLVVRPGNRADPEGYRLDSRHGRLVITAETDAGIFYGTRTALQSLRARGYVPSGVVDDRPDRPQRGLMVDIARKYFTKGWLMARVRELGDLKLNQLHLHLSDDQGFRVASDTHPEVVSREHLSKQDVRDIVRLAASRHVTVIPEIDSPGHLGAVLRAHPELQLRNASGTPVPGAMDISNPAAGRLIDDLDTEYAQLFPGRYWHLGGDEYRALMAADPESAYPRLESYARRRYGPNATIADAATGWLNDRAAAVRGRGKTVKAWSDGFHTSAVAAPQNDREVEYWTGREIGARQPGQFLRDGRDVVNLNDAFLYYVLGQPNGFTYPTGERIYRQWSPAVLRGTTAVPEGPGRILGARFAVWCDNSGAQTQAQVARGIRMPLRAMAQRLWHPGRPRQSWQAFVQLSGRVG
jgi:hexosaminidase